jgi:hypothetical protein
VSTNTCFRICGFPRLQAWGGANPQRTAHDIPCWACTHGSARVCLSLGDHGRRGSDPRGTPLLVVFVPRLGPLDVGLVKRTTVRYAARHIEKAPGPKGSGRVASQSSRTGRGDRRIGPNINSEPETRLADGHLPRPAGKSPPFRGGVAYRRSSGSPSRSPSAASNPPSFRASRRTSFWSIADAK